MVISNIYEIADFKATCACVRSEGREEGYQQLNELYGWLFSQGRSADIKRATHDPQYLKVLFAEYHKIA